MRRERRRRARAWLHRHLIVIMIIGGAGLVTTAFITWKAVETHQYTQRTDAETQRLVNESNEIARSAERRRTEEAQLLRQVQAQQAAEAAKTGDASTIDSAMCNASKRHHDPSSVDVLVNKKHCLQPLTYVPQNLTTVYGATLSGEAAGAFQQMYEAAAAEGQPFYVTSSYRSYSKQVSTYNRWVATSGQTGADTYSARPGYSEHQTGLAVDVAANGCTLDCFGKTSQYQWLQEHAASYGFIQRYYAGSETVTGYKAEEWHYRYVGATVAQDMQQRGVKTLEKYWGIPGGDY